MTKTGIVRSSATLVSRAKHPSSLPGHGGHTWRGCPFVQHGKEMAWQIQTWQEEPGTQPIQEDRTMPNFVNFSIFKVKKV